MSLYKTYGSLAKTNNVATDNSPNNVFIIDSIETKQQLINQSSQTEKLLIIDIYGDFCGPCKMIEPRYNEMSMQYSSVMFAKEDVRLELTEIDAVPFFEFWGYGKILETLKGADINKVAEIIQKYLTPRQGQSIGTMPPPMQGQGMPPRQGSMPLPIPGQGIGMGPRRPPSKQLPRVPHGIRKNI